MIFAEHLLTTNILSFGSEFDNIQLFQFAWLFSFLFLLLFISF